MRLRSFSLTTRQMRESTPNKILKDCTRRLNWLFARPGLHTMAVEKAQGLKKGQHPVHIRECVDIQVSREPLIDIVNRPIRNGQYEVAREGFPEMIGHEIEFVEMFKEQCSWIRPETPVTRIEFKHVFNVPVQAQVVA